MRYVVATYAITLAALGLYALGLLRERNKLRKQLSAQRKSNPG